MSKYGHYQQIAIGNLSNIITSNSKHLALIFLFVWQSCTQHCLNTHCFRLALSKLRETVHSWFQIDCHKRIINFKQVNINSGYYENHNGNNCFIWLTILYSTLPKVVDGFRLAISKLGETFHSRFQTDCWKQNIDFKQSY